MPTAPVVCLALASVIVIAAAQPAAAESCAGLPATTFAQLTPKQQTRFDSGGDWADNKSWRFMRASITIDRAPHLVKRILEDCPGVRVIGEIYANDERRLASTVEIVVTSYAAALRLARLSAISDLALYDATPRKLDNRHRLIKHPEPFLLERE